MLGYRRPWVRGNVPELESDNMPLTNDELREMARKRWSSDSAGVAKLIDRVVRRAPVLTPEQRDIIRAALDAAETDAG